MTRHRILLVDDEFWATPLHKLDEVGAIRLPFGGVGALATDGSVGFNWSISNYNFEHAEWESSQPAESLLDVVVGDHNAVAAFATAERPFDVVILDVDLSKFSPRPASHAEHFEGLGFFRSMAEFAARCGGAENTLFILYTRAPQVLTTLQPFLVRSRDELSVVRKIVRPLVLEFGKQSASSESAADSSDLLLEILEEHLESRAAARYRASTEFEATVALLRALVDSGKDDTRQELEQIRFAGAPMAHLFPFSIGKMRQAVSAEERKALAARLRRRLTCSFRNRLAEFWRKLATPFGGQPLRHIELITDPDAVSQAWEFLRGALDDLSSGECHDRFSTNFLLPLHRLVSLEPTPARRTDAAQYLGCIRDDAAGYCPITARLLAHRACGATDVPWLLSRHDRDAVESVINANARKHGQLPDARVGEPVVQGNEVVVQYFTGPAPADAARILASLGARRVDARLSDLRWTVCGLYDGWFELSSKNGERTTVISVPRAGEPTVTTRSASTFEEGTTYILHFPLGD